MEASSNGKMALILIISYMEIEVIWSKAEIKLNGTEDFGWVSIRIWF